LKKGKGIVRVRDYWRGYKRRGDVLMDEIFY
jgi:hypothetical protein